jgi:hypothetical protein
MKAFNVNSWTSWLMTRSKPFKKQRSKQCTVLGAAEALQPACAVPHSTFEHDQCYLYGSKSTCKPLISCLPVLSVHARTCLLGPPITSCQSCPQLRLEMCQLTFKRVQYIYFFAPSAGKSPCLAGQCQEALGLHTLNNSPRSVDLGNLTWRNSLQGLECEEAHQLGHQSHAQLGYSVFFLHAAWLLPLLLLAVALYARLRCGGTVHCCGDSFAFQTSPPVRPGKGKT